MAERRAPEPRRPRGSWLIGLSLALAGLLRVPLRRLGVDLKLFRTLLELRLTVDTRPSKSGGVAPESGNLGLVAGCGVNLVFGAVVALGSLTISSAYARTVLFSRFLLVYGATSLVSLLANLLFDRPLEALVATRPVDDRTVLAVKVVPILIYLALMEGALALPQMLMGAFLAPPLPFLAASLVVLVLASEMAAAVVLLGFAVALRFTSPERFKAVVVKLQLVLTIAFMLLPQIVNLVLMSRRGRLDSIDFGPWALLFPPAWFGDVMELALGQPRPWAFASVGLAITVPFAVLLLALRLARGRFIAGMTAPDAETPRSPSRMRPALALAPRVTRGQAERAGYEVALAIGARERTALMRTLPMLVFGIMMIVPIVRTEAGVDGLFLIVYGMVLPLTFAVFNLRYAEQPDAIWIADAAPLEDTAPLGCGAVRAMIVRFALVPGAIVAVAIAIVAELRGLLDIVAAVSFVILWGCAAAWTVNSGRPFSRLPQREDASMPLAFNLVLVVVTMLVAGAHLWMREWPLAVVAYALAAGGGAALAVARLRNLRSRRGRFAHLE